MTAKVTSISVHHFYGRRRNRSLYQNQQSAYDSVAAHYLIARPVGEPESIDPARFFDDFKPSQLWLEIGFGNGEHLVHQADLHRSVGIMGIEPFINGVAQASVGIVEEKLENIRIYPDDAMHVLPLLHDSSFAKVFLYFPDPWPKARHAKRRFIQPETVALLARLLRPQGVLHVATDIPELADWMTGHILAHPAFNWTAERRDDRTTPPDHWVTTKYQQKAVTEGRVSQYLDFVRR